MYLEAVQVLCNRLTYYQLNLFCTIIGIKGAAASDCEVSDGVALLFWTADFLSDERLLDQDRVRLWVETFSDTIIQAGDIIGREWARHESLKQLPRLKIGFFDGILATADGSNVFLNLVTGQKSTAIKNLRPKKSLIYDLGVLYAERMQLLKNRPVIPVMRERRNLDQKVHDRPEREENR